MFLNILKDHLESKIFLTWSINLWTIRWIRHSTVVKCWKEFLWYFITLETYRFKNPKLLHDFWSAPDSSHSVLDHCSSKYSHCTAAATVLPVLLYIPWTVFLVWNSHKESMRKFSYLLNHNGFKLILKEHSKKVAQKIFYKSCPKKKLPKNVKKTLQKSSPKTDQKVLKIV